MRLKDSKGRKFKAKFYPAYNIDDVELEEAVYDDGTDVPVKEDKFIFAHYSDEIYEHVQEMLKDIEYE